MKHYGSDSLPLVFMCSTTPDARAILSNRLIIIRPVKTNENQVPPTHMMYMNIFTSNHASYRQTHYNQAVKYPSY